MTHSTAVPALLATREGADAGLCGSEASAQRRAVCVRFTVEGPPVTWKRAKRGEGHSYTDPAMAAHKDRIRAAARNAGCRTPSGAPFHLKLWVYGIYDPLALQSGDLDNHEKIIKDSLNLVAWYDDRQVVHVEKWKAQDKTWPRTEIEIRAEPIPSAAAVKPPAPNPSSPAGMRRLLGVLAPKKLAKLNGRRLLPSRKDYR